jgi:hypothetical protein
MENIKVIIHLETDDAAAYFEKYADIKRIEVETDE